MTQPDHWSDRAACIGSPREWWFPLPYATDSAYHRAKIICDQCPVRQPCLEEAIGHDDRHGMFGGMTPRQRDTEHRRRGIRRHTNDFDGTTSGGAL